MTSPALCRAPVAARLALIAVWVHGGHQPQVHALHDALGARVGPAAGTQRAQAGNGCPAHARQADLAEVQRWLDRSPLGGLTAAGAAAAGAPLGGLHSRRDSSCAVCSRVCPMASNRAASSAHPTQDAHPHLLVVGAQPLGQRQREHPPRGLIAVHVANVPAGRAMCAARRAFGEIANRRLAMPENCPRRAQAPPV